MELPGDYIRDMLICQSLTQNDLADIMSVSISTIYAIYSGEQRITPQIASDLSEALGGSVQYWLDIGEEEKKQCEQS